jgi:NTP pyrophosphatase (non-canonical NTP hydrolase)
MTEAPRIAPVGGYRLGVADSLGIALEISAAQHLAWQNKLAKGFNVTDIALEFGLLTAEVSEAFTAWRNRLPDFGEELADILIYLAGLAQMTGIDLNAEVQHKLVKNAARVYEPDQDGILHRLDGPA